MTLQRRVRLLLLLSAPLVWLGQGDLNVGTFQPNRKWPEVQGLIGLFVNTIVLRSVLSDAPRFRDLLKREKNVIQEALAHDDMPFEKLVEVLNPHGPLEVRLCFRSLLYSKICRQSCSNCQT